MASTSLPVQSSSESEKRQKEGRQKQFAFHFDRWTNETLPETTLTQRIPSNAVLPMKWSSRLTQLDLLASSFCHPSFCHLSFFCPPIDLCLGLLSVHGSDMSSSGQSSSESEERQKEGRQKQFVFHFDRWTNETLPETTLTQKIPSNVVLPRKWWS